MRERSFQKRRNPIPANHCLSFNVQNRIGAQTRRKIDQTARDLVRIISKVEGTASGGKAAFVCRISYPGTEVPLHRDEEITADVPHNPNVVALNAPLVGLDSP